MGVAGYYRVSLARDEMRAPELYQGDIERYCSYKNLSLDHVFSDIDYSGYKNSEQRPALLELVRRRHEFSAVVIPKLSRFGRSMKHLAQLFETFDSEGINLIFLDLGMDTSTSQGRLLRHIMAAFAEYESDVKADYTRANWRMAALEGRPAGGVAPTGYRRENKTYVIDQEEAVVIREIFRRYDSGLSQRKIAMTLNESGLRLRNGGQWRGEKVGRVLDNPSYAALRLLDDELIPGQWEPIIDPELWKRLAKKRSAAPFQIPRQRGYKKPHHLLAGLIVCGACGRPAFHRTRGPNRPGGYYSCKNGDRDGQLPTGRCSNGGVGSPIAERFVTEAFLERASYHLMSGTQGVFSPTSQWESIPNAERRMVLAAAIEKVVIVPRREGEPKTTRRELSIQWRSVLAPVAPVPSTVYPDRATERFRQREARRPEKERQERSERAKRYTREWNEHRERFNSRQPT